MSDKDNKQTKQLEYPQSIKGASGTFTRYQTTNSCCITGKQAAALYAKNDDEGRSGRVYSLEALATERLVNEIDILVYIGIDQKIIEKLQKNNFTLFSQVEHYLNDNEKLGLTKTELDKLNEALGGAK